MKVREQRKIIELVEAMEAMVLGVMPMVALLMVRSANLRP